MVSILTTFNSDNLALVSSLYHICEESYELSKAPKLLNCSIAGPVTLDLVGEEETNSTGNFFYF